MANRWGFTVAEVLLTLALMTMAILALMGLSFSSLKATTKSADVTRGVQVAQQYLDRIIEQALADQPAGMRASFFDQDIPGQPWRTVDIPLGQTRFTVKLFVQTVQDSSTGASLGGAAGAGNRLKKVDAVVSWWDGDGQSQGRAGYGRLQTQLSQLVSETP